MTNYTKSTDFAVKDVLLTGNPNKLVKGSEVDVEFSNMELADATNVKKTGSTGSAVMPVGTTAQRDASPAVGYTRVNTTSGTLEWWDGTIWTSANGGDAYDLEVTTATAGQTVITTASSFVVGSHTLMVYLNGLLVNKTSDYTETTTNSFTFTSGLTAGDEVVAQIWRTNIATSGDALTVSYTPAGTGAVATTVQDALRSINLGSSSSHTDGTDTIVGSQRLYVGNNTPSSDDSAWLVCRGLSGSYFSGAHAYRDESTYTNPSGTGLFGYSSFDSIATIGGSVHWNHAHSYQARLQYTGSGLNDEIAGYTFQLTHNGVGTVTNVYGLKFSDSLGSGAIGNQVAVWVDPLTRGTGNYVIYSGSTSVASYHGGLFQFGTAPKISAAGFTTYGAILSHDASGNLLSNPNFNIVNGVLTMANATTSKITSSVAFNLQLDAVGIVESKKPVQFPVYTVATLPSPAASYTYCRAFVSDANATMTAGIGAVVAGGGANKVPVYCDGTNWRIG